MSSRPSPRYDVLLARLKPVLEVGGKKAELTARLGVKPPRMSEWLSGKQPTAEHLLGILEWLEEMEARG
jgi:transcriptional regulator with XRE-family HTH domain